MSADPSPGHEPRSTGVQSVVRAVDLLRAVARASGAEATTTALGERCGLNRATAWRILTTLESTGLVTCDRDSGRWSVGIGLVDLAAGSGLEALIHAARDVLRDVSERTGETAGLAVLRGGELVYVDEVVPDAVVAATWSDHPVPLHATSTGKAYLAALPREEAQALTGSILRRYTDTTLVDERELWSDIDRTGERGYGVCRGEFESSAWGVSAAVVDPAGRPVAVVSVWGPDTRIDDARFEELGAVAARAATALSPHRPEAASRP